VWMNSMFDPASDGTLTVDRTSGVAGGHELVVSAYDTTTKRFRLDNSWGPSWGAKGSAYAGETDMSWLLSQQGDVTVPQLIAEPTPTPPAPAPSIITASELAADIRDLLTAKGF
jgi:hypothetical protein